MAKPAAQARKRAAEEPYETRNVRQRVDSDVHRISTSAADLALDHLLLDPKDRPLHQRNFDQILDSLCSEEFMKQQIRQPLARIMQRALTQEVESSGKLRVVRREIIVGWAERMVKSVGQALGDLVDVSASGQPTWIKQEVANARFELKVTPMLKLDDDSDGDAAGGVQPRDSGVDVQTASRDHLGDRPRVEEAQVVNADREEEIVLDDDEAEGEGSSEEEVEIVTERNASPRDAGSDATDQSVDYEMLDKTPPQDEVRDHGPPKDGYSWPVGLPRS
ncbi:hypothetical protein LTR86_009564 [Recurvomyces mirabilis]|nr:hypothetical protein LTR86_009564 [Recurvomyces mirabilis]